MADRQPEKSKRQMVARLKQTVLGKMPFMVILFAAACVEGSF
jgi:hypothetical protein